MSHTILDATDRVAAFNEARGHGHSSEAWRAWQAASFVEGFPRSNSAVAVLLAVEVLALLADSHVGAAVSKARGFVALAAEGRYFAA